jgi:dienelactone hydrolase
MRVAGRTRDLLALPSKADHASWLKAKRRQLTRLLGGFAARSPLNAEVTRREAQEGRIVEWIRYEAEPGDVVPGVLLIPTGRTPPVPTVLCHHQHAGQYELGKSEVLGWAGNPQQAYAAELCRRGYIVFAPDCIGFEERAHPRLSGPEYERFLAHELLLQGLTLQGKMIWDVTRAVDYLVSRPDVDPARIGMIGHSLGACETWWSMALEPRIKVGAASCGVTSYRAVLAAERYHNFGWYVPGILKWGDQPEVVSMIAPRPFLALAGAEDSGFPIEGAKEVMARAGMLYRRLGVPDALALFESPGGHEFTDEMRHKAYLWFDKWL